jgi:hypothetical protein
MDIEGSMQGRSQAPGYTGSALGREAQILC